jgi:hypothetical protein
MLKLIVSDRFVQVFKELGIFSICCNILQCRKESGLFSVYCDVVVLLLGEVCTGVGGEATGKQTIEETQA